MSARCTLGQATASLSVDKDSELCIHVQPSEHLQLQTPCFISSLITASDVSIDAKSAPSRVSPAVQATEPSGDVVWLLQSAAAVLTSLRHAEAQQTFIFPSKTDALCRSSSGQLLLCPAFTVSSADAATTPRELVPIARDILCGTVIAPPEVVLNLKRDTSSIELAGHNSWIAGALLQQIVSPSLMQCPEFSQAASHELDAKLPISRSKLATALTQIISSLCATNVSERLSLAGAAEAVSRVCSAAKIQQQPAACVANVLFSKSSSTGALDVHHVQVSLPEDGLRSSVSSVCAAVADALAADGVELPQVHLAVPSWGHSLPSQLSYPFAPQCNVPLTLAHYGLVAVQQGACSVLHCALWASGEPSSLPPAAHLMGAKTLSQIAHMAVHGTVPSQSSNAAGSASGPAAEASAASPAAAAAGGGSNEGAPPTGDSEQGAAAQSSEKEQLLEAATPSDFIPAPEMTFPVRGFSSTDKNPYSKVEGNFASSIKWGSVMCTLKDSAGLSSGKHSWAFRVSKKGSRGGVCIGVATSEFNAATKNLGPALHSWGYSSSGKRSAGYPEFLNYAEGFGQDDVIGVHLDCDAGTLGFSKNGRYLGVAFTDLHGKSVFPAVCMGGRSSSSSSKRTILPHELEALTNAEEYTLAVHASQLQAPSDKPSSHFAWQLPSIADDEVEDTADTSVSGGGWDLHLRLPAGTDAAATAGTLPGRLALLQHPSMGQVADSNPTGRYEFGFDCSGVRSSAPIWFVLASSKALDALQQPEAGLVQLPQGVLQPGLWAISTDGHVVQDGQLSEDRLQWPDGLKAEDITNFGVVFGLPAVHPTTVSMTKDVPKSDLPQIAIVLNHKHSVSPADWQQTALWDACLARGGMRMGVAAATPDAGADSAQVKLRSNEIARMVSFDRANTHIQVSMGGTIAECCAQWASAPLAHSGMTRGKHVWSFKVLQRGAMGGICIGVAQSDFEFKHKNVGAFRGSWGWSSSGTKGHGEGSFVAYGEGYGTGDIVGVELDCDKGELRFHKNGVDQGVAFSTGLKGCTLVPAICLGGARSSSKSSKSSSVHKVQIYPSHTGVQQLQLSANASLLTESIAAVGSTDSGHINVTCDSIELNMDDAQPPVDSGVTIAAGPSVQLTSGDLPPKASWRFRVDKLHVQPSVGAAALRQALQTSLPHDGENMPAALDQLVQDWTWAQQPSAHAAAVQAHYSQHQTTPLTAVKATVADTPITAEASQAEQQAAQEDAPQIAGPNSDDGATAQPANIAVPGAPADVQGASTPQVSKVHMGVTLGIATDVFMNNQKSHPVGVGCDAEKQSVGLTGTGVMLHGGKCAWLTKVKNILRPFQFLQVGDVITVSIAPKEPSSKASTKGGGQAADGDGGMDGSTIIRLRDMQPLGGGGSKGGPSHLLDVTQLSAQHASGPVKLQDAALTTSSAKMTTSGSPEANFTQVQVIKASTSDQLTTEVSATGEQQDTTSGGASSPAPAGEAAPTPVEYSVSISINGQELCSPIPSELLPIVTSGQSVCPVISLGGGMPNVKVTLLTNAAEADAAVAASLAPLCIPNPMCTFVLNEQLQLPLSSLSEDASTVVFSRHWATVPIRTGLRINTPSTRGVWSPTHGIPLNSGIHAFHAMIRSKAEGGSIVLGFVSAAADSPFRWGRWHLGANSGSYGISSTGQVGGGLQRSAANTQQWRCFDDKSSNQSSGSAGPLFKSGSLVTWFVDTDVSEDQPEAKVGMKVDSNFLGTALSIPQKAFPLVPAVCAGGANGVSRHSVQLLQVPAALDRSQASKRAVLGEQDRLITCTTSWASAFVQHAGMRSGKHHVYWKLLTQAPAGAVCVGVADLRKFQVTARNVGADSHSWGYSSSGKLSAAKSGEFLDYSKPYRQHDIVGMHLDADSGQLSFSVNGISQGAALGSTLKSIPELVPALCVGSSRSGTPHSVKLMPALTREQVRHALRKGWRASWSPTFENSDATAPGIDGTPVLINAPAVDGAVKQQAAASAAGAAAAGAGQ